MFFSAAITVAAFVPLFTMQGVEGQIFNPMARTYGFAMAGALIATFTITPVLASFLLPAHIEEVETIVVRALRCVYSPVAELGADSPQGLVALAGAFLVAHRLADSAARHRISAGARGRQPVDPRLDAADHLA